MRGIATSALCVLLAGCGATTGALGHDRGVRWATAPTAETVEDLRGAAQEGRATPEDLALLGSLEELLGRPTEALRWLTRAVSESIGRSDDLTGAESAAAQLGALEGRAAGWGEAVEELAQRLDGQRGSPELTFAIQGLRVRLADRQGTPEEVEEAVSAAGCLTTWQAAGPFGPFALLSFDDAHGPTEPGPLQSTYDLGSGRGRAATFSPDTRGCDVTLSAPLPGWGGTIYAVTYAELATAGHVVLTLDTTASARVFVNDVEVLVVDRRRQYLPAVATARLWLPSGRSKVVVALTSRYPGPSMVVTLTDLEGRPVVAGATRTSPEGYSPARPFVLAADRDDERQPSSPMQRYLAALRAISEGDAERSRALIEDGPDELSESAAGLIARAMSYSVDPTVPYDVARNRALALLRQASELEPAAWRPCFELARHDADEERYEESLRRLRQGLERAPEQPALWMLYASLLTTRGLWSESEEAIDRVAELAPDSCDPANARLALAQARHRLSDAVAAAEALVACDRSSDALARVHLSAERFEEAADELRRVIERRGEQTLLLDDLAHSLRGQGDTDEELRVLRRMVERDPEDRVALLDLVDLDVEGGRTPAALDALAYNVAVVPTEHLLERRLHALLSDGELLEPFRVDGRERIAEYEASNVSYEVPSVLVLDRTVFRIYPDGSVIELTHGITRVQSAEGIEAEGEFHVPRGAALLTVRTVKADGTLLEPEDIEGKESLSLPNLEVGDYVETEYLRGVDPPPEFPGGVWPWRFYFQGYRQAFHHSELVVVAPTDLSLDLSWRGEALEQEHEETGDLQVMRWVAHGMGTLPDEPDGPNRDEVVPSLQISSGASWALYRRALAEALADRDRPSAELVEMARAVTAEAETDDDRIDAIYRWVGENVEDGGDPLAQVSHMLAARTGERTRLAAAMARAVGLDVRMGFARSSYADQSDDPVPSLDMFAYPLFRVGPRWVYLDERARWSPSCFIPADLRGQRVLMLEGDPLFSTLPAEGCQPDGSRVHVRLTMGSDGRAQGTVEEVHSGAEAVRWRTVLGRTPPEERQGTLEEDYVADVLEGALVTDLEIRGEDDLDHDLTIVYHISDLQLGESPSPGVLRVVLPYQSELASGYASLPVRQTPLVIRTDVNERVQFEIELPPGATARLPSTAHTINLLGEFSLTGPTSRRATGTIRLERQVSLRSGRVPPASYAAFAAFCRDVDRIEQQDITVALP